MFDFDPDEMEDEIDEGLESAIEEEADIFDPEEDPEAEAAISGVAAAGVGAVIYGMGKEAGEEEARRRTLEKKGMKAEIEGERPDGAISLRAKKKKGKLPKFEQWVKDVISGKKDLDDDM